MDDFIEILLEVFFETVDSVASSKRFPRWIRIISGIAIVLFVVGISVLLIAAGIGSKNICLTILDVLFFAVFILYVIYKIKRRKI